MVTSNPFLGLRMKSENARKSYSLMQIFSIYCFTYLLAFLLSHNTYCAFISPSPICSGGGMCVYPRVPPPQSLCMFVCMHHYLCSMNGSLLPHDIIINILIKFTNLPVLLVNLDYHTYCLSNIRGRFDNVVGKTVTQLLLFPSLRVFPFINSFIPAWDLRIWMQSVAIHKKDGIKLE